MKDEAVGMEALGGTMRGGVGEERRETVEGRDNVMESDSEGAEMEEEWRKDGVGGVM